MYQGLSSPERETQMNAKVHPIFREILHDDVLACPSCGYSGGTHALNCVINLQTPEQRVRYAAHLCRNSYWPTSGDHGREAGLTELEIESGRKLAQVQKYNEQVIRSIYGDPAYGSSTISPDLVQSGKDAEQAVIDEHLAQCEPEPERKPTVMEQVTLEEQLFHSTQLVNYRRGRVA
jgi:hypothetical protein